MIHRVDPADALDPADDQDELNLEFGRRVRALRERAELTLEALAVRSGVSRAMLSKVERGEKSPTIGVAKRIAHALHTTLSFLTGGVEDRQAVVVVQHDQRHVFRDSETGFERHILSPSMAGSAVELLLHRLPAGVSTGMMPAYRSGTEKLVTVAQGELVVELPDREIALSAGDTLFFEARQEHAFSNRSRKPCAYYLVISCRDDK